MEFPSPQGPGRRRRRQERPGRRSPRPIEPRGHVPFDETASHVLAAALLALAVLGVLPAIVAVPLAVLASGSGAVSAIRRRRAAARQRQFADAVLAHLPGQAVPEGLRWRAAELGSADHRRFVARQLHQLARTGERRTLLTSVPVYLETLRPNVQELDEVAEVVAQVDRPLGPRALVLLEEMLGNGDTSPLYRPASAEELGEALQRIHAELERRAA